MSPEIRARLVAQETKRASQLGTDNPALTFAATPPLEGLRAILSLAMTGPKTAEKEEIVRPYLAPFSSHRGGNAGQHSAWRYTPIRSSPGAGESASAPQGWWWDFLSEPHPAMRILLSGNLAKPFGGAPSWIAPMR